MHEVGARGVAADDPAEHVILIEQVVHPVEEEGRVRVVLVVALVGDVEGGREVEREARRRARRVVE